MKVHYQSGAGPAPAWEAEPPPPAAWKLDGSCRQNAPDAWYPAKGGSARQVKAICADCPVQAACLEYALTNGERWGIWGGLSAAERQKLRPSPRRSRAPHNSHPDAARREPRVRCDCGLPKCQGVVAASTRKGHRREARQLAAPLAA